MAGLDVTKFVFYLFQIHFCLSLSWWNRFHFKLHFDKLQSKHGLDKLYVLINIYAPNKDKDIVNFLNNLRTILQNENLADKAENMIIGCDFNFRWIQP